jgi:hypothetical protein
LGAYGWIKKDEDADWVGVTGKLIQTVALLLVAQFPVTVKETCLTAALMPRRGSPPKTASRARVPDEGIYENDAWPLLFVVVVCKVVLPSIKVIVWPETFGVIVASKAAV